MKLREKGFKFIFLALIIITILSVLITVSIGSVKIEISDVYKIILNELLGGEVFNNISDESIKSIVLDIRLPRVFLSILVGGALTVVGILMQAVSRNVLADPYILGLSSGASTGAVLALTFGGSLFGGVLTVSLGAFLGALLAALLVVLIYKLLGNNNSILLLAGVAISALFSSITNLMIFMFNDAKVLQQAMFWMVGSFGKSQWKQVIVALIVILIGFLIIMCFYKTLDILLIGDSTATTLGVNVNQNKLIILILGTLITGVVVSMAGTIGFVGLIIPHITRGIIGGNHKKVIPIGFLIGGIFLNWADLIARTIAAPQEIPIGVITAFIGVPFYIYILWKDKTKGRVLS